MATPTPLVLLFFSISFFVTLNDGATCGDKTCDFLTENCFSCPNDCSCAFSGVRLDSWPCGPSNLQSCVGTSGAIISPAVSGFLPSIPGPVTGRISGYLLVSELTHATLLIDGQNVGGRLNVDGTLVANSFLVHSRMNETVHVILSENVIHYFILEFFSLSNASPRSVRLLWQKKHSNAHSGSASFEVISNFHYNINACGDRIEDPQERNSTSQFYCSIETNKVAHNMSLASCLLGVCNLSTRCGNGLCPEKVPDDCFADCHPHITRTCNTVAVKPGLISGMESKDTIGDLIKNQMLMHLPGIEHLASGVNIITGKESETPLFYQSYCDTQKIETIQDSYRGMVYTIPDGLSAIPSPKCVYSTSSQRYASVAAMERSFAKSYAFEKSISGQAHIDTLFWGDYSLSGSYAGSYEKSVKIARSLRQKRSGSIMVTDITCETSKVEQSALNFHPMFLADLARVSNFTDILPLMQKYGTHYYKSATMGGRLRQIKVLDSVYEKTKTLQDVQEASEISMTASVSANVFEVDASLSASYASSKDSSISFGQQKEFESQSSKSSIITYGGPPGAFGPGSSMKTANNFGEWASDVDLLPVPIDYQLLPIYTAIPEKWKTENGTAIRDVWKEAQSAFRKKYTRLSDVFPGYKYTLYYFPDPSKFAADKTTNFHLTLDDITYVVMDQVGPSGSYAPLYPLGEKPYVLPFDFYYPFANWTGNANGVVGDPNLFNGVPDAAASTKASAGTVKIVNWSTSKLRSWQRADGTWRKQSDWNNRVGLYFEITKKSGLNLVDSVSTGTTNWPVGHFLEVTIKGDNDNNRVHLQKFSATDFPTNNTRAYYTNIQYLNYDSSIKSLGLRFGSRGMNVTQETSFVIKNLWTAHTISGESTYIATVHSMGPGEVVLSNFDDHPQYVRMYRLNELL